MIKKAFYCFKIGLEVLNLTKPISNHPPNYEEEKTFTMSRKKEKKKLIKKKE